MDVWLEFLVEPSKLILAWQAPDGQIDRRRWAVGVLSSSDGHAFRYFSHAELKQYNNGRDERDLKRAGFSGYPAFAFTPGAIFARDALHTFLRRIPPRNREDFPKFQAYFSIPPAKKLTGSMLLALTEARLPGDGFSLIDPLDPEVNFCDSTFEIAGFRYEAGESKPHVGDLLELVPDLGNIHDPDAIAVKWNQTRIGFVNRLQAGTVGKWLRSRSVAARILRFNGRVDAARAYAKIEVRPLTVLAPA